MDTNPASNALNFTDGFIQEIILFGLLIAEFEGVPNTIDLDNTEYEEVYPQCPFPRPEGYENTLLIVEEAYLIPSNPILPSSYSIL